MVPVRFPDADGLLGSGFQMAFLGHQSSPHTGSAHVDSDVEDFGHEGGREGGQRLVARQIDSKPDSTTSVFEQNMSIFYIPMKRARPD